jgi:hypothetical protein
MKKAEFEVGDLVEITWGYNRKRPGVITKRYAANYDTVGHHWRYRIRYLKDDLSEARASISADLRADSIGRLDKMKVLEMLAKLPAT